MLSKMQYFGGTMQETVDSVTLFHMTMSELCRVLCLGIQYQLSLNGKACTRCVCRLTSVVGRRLLWNWLQYECLCPLLLHLQCWAASDQPEPCLQRAGTALHPILCLKVKRTSHRPLVFDELFDTRVVSLWLCVIWVRIKKAVKEIHLQGAIF